MAELFSTYMNSKYSVIMDYRKWPYCTSAGWGRPHRVGDRGIKRKCRERQTKEGETERKKELLQGGLELASSCLFTGLLGCDAI